MANNQAPGPGASLGERAWWAYHCLPRYEDGGPPCYSHLEEEYGFAVGQLRRLLVGERRGAEADTLRKISRALQVSVYWLLEGLGDAPTPTGDVPPWPGRTT